MKNYYYLILLLFPFISWGQTTILSEDFSIGFNGWTAIDVAGDDAWDVTGGEAVMNGWGGTDDEDWFISPSVDLSIFVDEYLMFDYNDAFDGSLIELYYSNDYNGSGILADFQSATWTNIPLYLWDINQTACFSTLFQQNPAIDISGITGSNVYFAFKYVGTSTTSKSYKLDNFDIVANYYGSVEGFISGGGSCAALKTELYNTINKQLAVVEYTSSNYDLWDALMVTDKRRNDADNADIVWDMFTDIPSGTGEVEFDHCADRDNGSCPGGEGQCYNREHSFPRSWWGGTTAYPTDTQNFDLHHIVPSDRLMNTYKLNWAPGVVTNVNNTGSNGIKFGTNPAYPNCSGGSFWEPIDAYKGDYARMYLYFATRYENDIASWETINTAGDCALSGDSYIPYEPWLMDVLLTWHEGDPVSQKEIDRNNAVFALQGNRNPFIDHPEYIGFIWGDINGNTCDELANPCTPATGTEVITACDTYDWIDGNTYTSSNNTATYTFVGGAADGCDSIVTLDLTINTFVTGTDIISACETYDWIDGNTYTASNSTATYTFVGGATNGCDSIVTLNLTINNANTGTDVIISCAPITWIDGNTYSTSNNSATHTLMNAAGCDSVVTLDFTLSSFSSGTEVVSACETYDWIDGNTYTSSNNTATHTIVGGAASGCDSVVTLNLTIYNSATGTDVITACDSYDWIDGNTYTSSNNSATHTIVGGAANGCDSVVTLNLTINNSTTGTDVITACDTYIWIDGNTYTASNSTATHTLPNAAGCDSTVTLNLTINASPTVTLDPVTTLCQQDGAVTLVGTPAGGTYAGSSVMGNQFDPSIGMGNYTVTYDYTDGSTGCSNSDAQNIVVENCASIEEEGLSSLVIYPNPTSGKITINGEVQINSVEIYDELGRLILKESTNGSNIKIDLSHLENGVYHVKLITTIGNRINRVVVE